MNTEKQIEHPKVFISYAWGTKEHDEKVLALATELMEVGIEVVLDKWDLKEGNDTYSFMEKSVSDDSITNVLILIDPNYVKKANARVGGVGTETQIISSEVYNRVEQSKFIPVVFERDEEGNVCKPHYLNVMLHFDLSKADNYDEEFQRMVRFLYGIETYKKPELGNAPAWLNDESSISYKTAVKSDYFRSKNNESEKLNKYSESLQEIKEQVLNYEFTKESVVMKYLELKPYRDNFLVLLKDSDYVQNSYELISVFLEELMNTIRVQNVDCSSLKQSFVHECFIYVVAYFLKKKQWKSLRYMLNKTYFVAESYFNHDNDSYNCFYVFNGELDEAVNKRDGKVYLCGTAELWVENINIDICSKAEFVFGDLFCYSASLMITNYDNDWPWFPLTYAYENSYNGLLSQFTKKLVSSEHLEHLCFVLNYDSEFDFKQRFMKIEEMFKAGELRQQNYGATFNSANNFWNYITTDNLGRRN